MPAVAIDQKLIINNLALSYTDEGPQDAPAIILILVDTQCMADTPESRKKRMKAIDGIKGEV